MTAAQRKKLKKKQKEKAKKAEGGDKDAPAKKGPAKKESAAVRKLREDLERQKAEQEAAQKAEEERIRLVRPQPSIQLPGELIKFLKFHLPVSSDSPSSPRLAERLWSYLPKFSPPR